MRVLLVSTYELGHQPLHVASPAGALLAAGHEVACLDVAVDPLDPSILEQVDVVGISVPMHTAMRLGVEVASRIREEKPALPIAFYGLYAAMSGDPVVRGLADALISGEYEGDLVQWVADGGAPRQVVSLASTDFSQPARHVLPNLDRYAHLSIRSEQRLAGYVEASHGCRHRCRHCPIPVVYDGRFRVVPVENVMADVTQLVAQGAQHITIGDPDFFNGPRHALRLVRALHHRFPQLTYDVTIKVEHLLKYPDLLAELAAAGVIFIVSAFESTNDGILSILDKGHTSEDMGQAVSLVRSHDMEIRPTWLPFTPWTSLHDMVDLFDFLALHDLFESVDPIQTTIRLLVPYGSLLVDEPAMAQHLQAYDPNQLAYPWVAPDGRLDELQQRMTQIVESSLNDSSRHVMERLWTLVLETAGRPIGDLVLSPEEGRPRLTEPWFC